LDLLRSDNRYTTQPPILRHLVRILTVFINFHYITRIPTFTIKWAAFYKLVRQGFQGRSADVPDRARPSVSQLFRVATVTKVCKRGRRRRGTKHKGLFGYILENPTVSCTREPLAKRLTERQTASCTGNTLKGRNDYPLSYHNRVLKAVNPVSRASTSPWTERVFPRNPQRLRFSVIHHLVVFQHRCRPTQRLNADLNYHLEGRSKCSDRSPSW